MSGILILFFVFTVSMETILSEFDFQNNDTEEIISNFTTTENQFVNISEISNSKNIQSTEVEDNNANLTNTKNSSNEKGHKRNVSATVIVPEQTTTGLNAPAPDKKLKELKKQQRKAKLAEKKSRTKKKHRHKNHKHGGGTRRHGHKKSGESDLKMEGGRHISKAVESNKDSRKKHKAIMEDATNCVGCDLTEKEKRIESLRTQILQKLRIESVPVPHSSAPRLPPQYHANHMQADWAEEDDVSFYAVTKELIIPASDVSHHCVPRLSIGCYRFDLRGKINRPVSSAKLWLFKNRDQNDKQQIFTISELEQDTSYNFIKLRPKNIVSRIETDVKKGWLQFNVTSTIRNWLDDPTSTPEVSVQCQTCYNRNRRVLFGAKEGYIPLLVVTMGDERRRRKRRSIDCHPGVTSCCRQQFYIKFSEIDNFVNVLQPKGIWANYCTGSCHEAHMAQYNHTTLIQAKRWRSSDVNRTFTDTIKPCCAPISYTTKSMLIIEESGSVSYKEIPNISVHACGCV